MLGFSGESELRFVKQREEVYPQLFGEGFQVNHEIPPCVPHVDIYVFAPTHRRDYFALVTGGMSNVPMRIPAGPFPGRAELVLYVAEPSETAIEYLRFLAHIPHDQGTWYSPGSTMTNGVPPQPVFENSCLDCVTFLPSPIASHRRLEEMLRLDGSPVGLLWVVPITFPERELVQCGCIESLLDVFERNRHPIVLREDRESYV